MSSSKDKNCICNAVEKLEDVFETGDSVTVFTVGGNIAQGTVVNVDDDVLFLSNVTIFLPNGTPFTSGSVVSIPLYQITIVA
jgi:transcription elongation factor